MLEAKGTSEARAWGFDTCRGPWPRLAVSAEPSQAGILGGAGKRPALATNRCECNAAFPSGNRERSSLGPGPSLSDARNLSVAYLEAI